MDKNGYGLGGKTALITGASRGLGLEIAKEYSRNGADIFFCARNPEGIDEAKKEIESCRSNMNQKVSGIAADTGSEKDIDRLVETVIKEAGGFDILVNNAAIQGPIGKIEENDWDKWKQALTTDLLGPVYLMRKAIEHFKQSGKRGKIVSISGGGATGSRPNFSAYAAAKVAIVRLTELLADETREYGIDINAIAPGAMRSSMTDEIMNAGEKGAGEKEIRTAEKLIAEGDKCKEKAAALALFLASDDSNGVTGRLISASWDKWDLLGRDREELAKTDVYTLRRITARDRGFEWDV